MTEDKHDMPDDVLIYIDDAGKNCWYPYGEYPACVIGGEQYTRTSKTEWQDIPHETIEHIRKAPVEGDYFAKIHGQAIEQLLAFFDKLPKPPEV